MPGVGRVTIHREVVRLVVDMTVEEAAEVAHVLGRGVNVCSDLFERLADALEQHTEWSGNSHYVVDAHTGRIIPPYTVVHHEEVDWSAQEDEDV